jgi:hypothetical protein
MCKVFLSPISMKCLLACPHYLITVMLPIGLVRGYIEIHPYTVDTAENSLDSQCSADIGRGEFG